MASRREPPALHRRDVLALAGAAAISAAPALARQPRRHTITLAQMAFGPAPAGLRVGDVIEWINADIFRHSATARDGSFDVDLVPKARARITLRKAGAIDFYCRYHPGMTGRLQVAKA